MTWQSVRHLLANGQLNKALRQCQRFTHAVHDLYLLIFYLLLYGRSSVAEERNVAWLWLRLRQWKKGERNAEQGMNRSLRIQI